MKKFLIFTLVVCMMIPIASADGFDLKTMSIDQLNDLRNSINAEIQSRPEWKQVTVPPGEWIIGVDIPAGYYSITALDKLAITQAAPAGSPYDDFYHVLAANGSVGKVLFVDGSIFKTSSTIILAPPVALDF